MGRVLPVAAVAARDRASGFGSGPLPVPEAISGSGNEDWFYDAAIAICGGKDAGYQLHLFTGWPLTSCRYFMLRDPGRRRKPPAEFLRILFRSPHGEPFFRAFMHGCEARWFAALVRSDERARAAEARLAAIRALAD